MKSRMMKGSVLSVLTFLLPVLGCSSAPRVSSLSPLEQDSGFRDPAYKPIQPRLPVEKKGVRENDLCVCMIGEYPESQQKWFTLGCSIWFTKQKCDAKRRIVEGEAPGLAEILDESHRRSKIVLGFVGHWGSTDQTISWLKKDLLPAASKYEMDLRVDNTACLGGDDPLQLHDRTGELLKKMPLKNLEVRVNQEVSRGMRDPYLSGKNNFWVEYRNQDGAASLEFPSCKAFENSSCWGWMQGGGSGFCQESVDGKMVPRLLVCSQVEREVYTAPVDGDSGLRREKRTIYQWTRMELGAPAFEIVEKKVHKPLEFRIGLKNNRFYDAVVAIDSEVKEEEEHFFARVRGDYLEQLPEQVHVDAGDESLDEKTIERSVYSLNDVVVKERRSAYSTSRHMLMIRRKGEFGKVTPVLFGIYPTRAAAEAASERLIQNPLILKNGANTVQDYYFE